MKRAKPTNFRRSISAAILSALMLAIQSEAQVSEGAAFIQRAEALQSALNDWQGILKTMSFSQASLSNPSLGDRRGQCLEWIPIIRIGIGRVNKIPAFGQQFSLLSSLTYFDNSLLNLRDALQLARAMEQDQVKVEAIRKGLHGFYTELQSQLFQGLRAVQQESQHKGGPASHEPGEVSGHVYHADTGKPLVGAIVTLESPTSPQSSSSDRMQRTHGDGSYEFSGVPPGNYWVIAYENGFVGSVHGVGTSQNASDGLISVAPGHTCADINFRLNPTPETTTLSGVTLEKELANHNSPLAYGPGSFSPNGKRFAFAVAGPDPEQVCLYDLDSHSLKCVTGQGEWGPVHSKTGAIDYLAWNGGTVYAQPILGGGPPIRVTPGGPRPLIPYPVTSPATQLFGPLPQAVLRAFLQGLDHGAGTAGNCHFIVTAWYGVLAMSTADGEDPYTIATGGRALDSFVFDPDRSLVYYPVPGRYHGAIVSFDLNTKRYDKVRLPFSAGLKLLDVKRERDTTLAAYIVDGPCVPTALASGENPWILPDKPLPAVQTESVCLVTLPGGTWKYRKARRFIDGGHTPNASHAIPSIKLHGR